MNLIGFFCLAWALLACDQDEGKDNPGVSFPDYGEVLAFPGAEGYGRHATGGRTGVICFFSSFVSLSSLFAPPKIGRIFFFRLYYNLSCLRFSTNRSISCNFLGISML